MDSGEPTELNLEIIEARLEEIENANLVSKDVKSNLIIRLLMLCTGGKSMQKYAKEGYGFLKYILIQKNGLASFIGATCDFDSQIKTSLEERFRALARIVVDLPVRRVDAESYYSSISAQVLRILASATEDANPKLKLATIIFIALYEKDKALAETCLIQPIKDTVSCKEGCVLTLTQSIKCIHRLIMNDFDKDQFISVFPNVLVIYAILFETVSPIKRDVKEIIIDMLKYVDQSIYLLDATLCNLQMTSTLYTTGLIKYENDEILTVIPSGDSNDTSSDDLTFCSKMITMVLSILDELGNQFKLDFFLILIEKVNLSMSKQRVLFLLVDALQEQVSNLILDYPGKAIQFLTSTLRRITSDSSDSIQSLVQQDDLIEEEKILESTKILHMDSLSMLIQIVSILIEAKNKLTNDDLLSLKTCNTYLTRVVTSELISKSERLKIESLMKEIEQLNETSKHSDIDEEDRFQEAVRCLNSNFMPQRAHGLIILRKLIDCKHPSTIYHKSEIFTLIKACLSDPDSYIYLAAVNALASLALAHTETCLPTLIESYHDKERSVRERVSVGESLVWVCKYIGQLAHHYRLPVVDCFLTGLKDENESIRVSSLSNLGQFCSSLQNSLSYCIVEIICAVECVLKSDPSLDVKRACLMFLYVMLNGIENPEIILDQLKQIYHIIKSIDSKSLGDDLIRVHTHLALEAIDNLMERLMKTENDLIRPIKLN